MTPVTPPPDHSSADAAGGSIGPADELIDREACMGSGNCLYWAPEVFDLDDEGVAVIRGDPSAHEEQVGLAARNCPTRAIRAAPAPARD